MPIDPVKIPQNVYIEDRIVGPLTLRQIIIIAVGGGISYVLYTTFAKALQLGIVGTVLAWIPCAIAVAFALVKINDLSLFRICLLTIESMNKPALRTWAPRQGITIHFRTVPPAAQAKSPTAVTQAPTVASTENRIRELTSFIDHPLPTLPDVEEEPIHELIPHGPETVIEEVDEGPKPTFPVDPNRVSVDKPEDPENGGLSAYRNVFRDISPSH